MPRGRKRTNPSTSVENNNNNNSSDNNNTSTNTTNNATNTSNNATTNEEETNQLNSNINTNTNANSNSDDIPIDPIPKRRSERNKKKVEGGGNEEPEKKKCRTIGQYLFQEREEKVKEIDDTNILSDYEVFQNYNKDDVITNLHLDEVPNFNQQLYKTPTFSVVFLSLSTGVHPKEFSHICNNKNVQWNLKDFEIPFSDTSFHLGNVILLFVQGEFIEGAPKTSNIYKCLGLVGVESTSAGSKNNVLGNPYVYLRATFVFDYVISRKELETQFGLNVMKCKKNKYGCSICA